jgi:syntaxin 7
MSFSDVGKGGPKRPNRTQLSTQPTIPESQEESLSDGLRQLSDGILQYQRNLGILERIAGQVGTKSDGPVLEQQFQVQVDVLKQLGEKLNSRLKLQEEQLESLSRNEAAKKRATQVKLSRDFRRVEASFKNIQLEVRRKRAQLHQAQIQAQQTQQVLPQDQAEFQQQLQLEDKLAEEIMRERQEEIQGINRGMHQVNEIYKDLAHIVGSQQEQIDQIETQMEDSKINAEKGLEHVMKANEKASATSCVIS